ncbi:MAG: hypothetical protein V5A46_00140 [Haloferacaceae archaeon]
MKALPILLSVLLVVAAVGAGAFPPGESATVGDDADSPVRTADSPAPTGDGPTPTDEPDPTGTAIATSPAIEGQLDPAAGNATRVLGLADEEVERSDIRRDSADIGPALSFGVNTTAADLRTEAIERRIEAANTTDERQRRILAELSEIEQQEVTLNQRERAAVDAYAAGDIDARELTVRLARVSMESQLLRERLGVVREEAEETPEFSIGARANNLDFKLRTYDGPVRDHVRRVLTGESPPERVFAETDGNGIVLTMLDGDTYVREATMPNRRDRSTTGSMTLETAENVTFTNYPGIAATRKGANSIGSAGIVIVEVPHDAGLLTTYVDGGSERVFREHQRIELGNATGSETVGDVQEGLNVTVDRSYPGGPVRVTVLDAETDRPVVGATVTVGDAQRSTVVGPTDDDGQRWLVSPRDRFLLTVLGEGTTVARLEIEPTGTPHLERYEPENETG